MTSIGVNGFMLDVEKWCEIRLRFCVDVMCIGFCSFLGLFIVVDIVFCLILTIVTLLLVYFCVNVGEFPNR